MVGWDNALIPFFVVYVLYQIPPTLMEVFSYYTRGGLVKFDITKDESFGKDADQWRDNMVYLKRFCDRPTSDAAKSFYGYLDWSSATYDKSLLIYRRNLMKHVGDTSPFRIYIYGPFVFNWKRLQWLRGDDAAGFLMPMWGEGGEERARAEYQAAKDKGLNRYWYLQIMKKIRREQAAKEALAKGSA